MLSYTISGDLDTLRVQGPGSFDKLYFVKGIGSRSDFCLLAADRYACAVDDNGALNIIDILSDAHRVIRAPKGGKFGKPSWVSGSASRDGEHLFLQWYDVVAKSETVAVFNLPKSVLVAVHARPAIMGNSPNHPVENADGSVLFSFAQFVDSSLKFGLTCFNWKTGQVTEDFDTAPSSINDRFATFHAPSPDGRYWLRPDFSQLPVKDVRANKFALFGDKQRYYGLPLQLWEANPLRHVRTLIVAWVPANCLPNQGDGHSGWPEFKKEDKHNVVFNDIAKSLASQVDGPHPTIERGHFPERWAGNDTLWFAFCDSWQMFVRRWGEKQTPVWEPDGKAFWATYSGFVFRVSIEGVITPQMMLSQLGLRRDAWLPATEKPIEIRPLSSSVAALDFQQGTAVLDVSKQAFQDGHILLPQAAYRWAARDNEEARNLKTRIDKLKKEQSTIVISAKGWSNDQTAEAMEALSAEIKRGLTARAIGGEVRFVFSIAGQKLGEKEYFAKVSSAAPESSSAIAAMLECLYRELTDTHAELFSNGSEAVGILGYAAAVLASTGDIASLQTLRRYGELMDREHESHFARSVAPAAIRHHGWNPHTIDFALWVMAHDFNNSLQDFDEVWSKWDLRSGAKNHYGAEEFAVLVRERFIGYGTDEELELARYGHPMIDQLVETIDSNDAYSSAFIATLTKQR
jgi:hypothetical protein